MGAISRRCVSRVAEARGITASADMDTAGKTLSRVMPQQRVRLIVALTAIILCGVLHADTEVDEIVNESPFLELAQQPAMGDMAQKFQRELNSRLHKAELYMASSAHQDVPAAPIQGAPVPKMPVVEEAEPNDAEMVEVLDGKNIERKIAREALRARKFLARQQQTTSAVQQTTSAASADQGFAKEVQRWDASTAQSSPPVVKSTAQPVQSGEMVSTAQPTVKAESKKDFTKSLGDAAAAAHKKSRSKGQGKPKHSWQKTEVPIKDQGHRASQLHMMKQAQKEMTESFPHHMPREDLYHPAAAKAATYSSAALKKYNKQLGAAAAEAHKEYDEEKGKHVHEKNGKKPAKSGKKSKHKSSQ